MEVPACTDVSALGVSGAVAPVKRRRSGPKSKSSPYIGVTQYKRTGRYEAHIWIVEMRGAKGHQRHLGSYATAEDAARCYDRAALRLRGPGAELNFPLEDYSEDPFLIAHSKVDKFRFLDLLRAEFAIQSDRPSSFAARARAGVSPSARRGAPPAGRGLPGAVRSPMKAAAAPASRMGPLRGAADMGSRRVEGSDWRGTLSSAQTSTPPPYMVTGWYAGGDASGRGSAQASAHVSREAYALGGLEEDLLGSSWNDLGAGWGGADGSGSRAGGWGYHDPSAHVGWRVQGYVGAPRSALERGYTPPESSVGLHPSQLSSLESQTHGGGLYGAGVDGSRAYFMPYGEGLSPSSRAVGYAQNQNTAAGLSQSAPAHYSTGAGSGLGPASGLTQAFGAEGSLDPQPGVPLSPPVLGSSSSAPLSPAGAPYTPVASALHSPPLGSAQGRPLGAVSMPMHSGLGHPSHHPSLPACQPASGALSPPHVLARGGGVEGEGLQSTPLSDQTWISPDGDLRADAARLEDAASHLLGDDPLAYSSLFGPWDHV